MSNKLDLCIDDNPEIFLDARLGYRNKNDPEGNWTEIMRSHERRALKCNFSVRVFIIGPLRQNCIPCNRKQT